VIEKQGRRIDTFTPRAAMENMTDKSRIIDQAANQGQPFSKRKSTS
jgi:hypothetical protein